MPGHPPSANNPITVRWSSEMMDLHGHQEVAMQYFTGPYAKMSTQYLLSSLYTSETPMYERHILQFRLHRPPGPMPFFSGAPAMITIKRPTSQGIHRHALYGMVRTVSEGIDHTFWPLVKCIVIMEVHCIPEYGVDSCHTRLWTGLPHDAVYIQPHGFLEPDYCPIWLLALDEEEDIIMIELSQSSHLTKDEFTTHCKDHSVCPCCAPAS